MFKVAVQTGEVKVQSEDVDRKVGSGKQISIDRENNIRESVYLGTQAYLLIGMIVLVLALFYRLQNKHKKK